MSVPNPPDSTPVFIVEDHNLVRRVLRTLIQRSPGFRLCGEASSAEAALVEIPNARPELVLVDVSLPGMNGIDLIRILHEEYPEMLLLALSAHDESFYGPQALSSGARGYVMKEKSENLLEALQHVRKGGIYMSDKLRTILESSVS